MIKTGGESSASKEVEDRLFQHPAVAEATVFGVPDLRWIEAVARPQPSAGGPDLATPDNSHRLKAKNDRNERTRTSPIGVGRREGRDASTF